MKHGKELNEYVNNKIQRQALSNFILLLFIIRFATVCFPQQAKPIHTKHYLNKEGTDEILLGYQLYLPPDYEQIENKLPLILFLHGANLRGDNLDKVLEVGIPRLLEDGKQLPFVVVSPQCRSNTTWSVSKLDLLLNSITSNFKVDTNRIYLTGFSMGGAGTWAMALRYPKRFAAVAPVSGWEDTTYAEVLKDLPIWVFHGDSDQIISVKESENMVNKISALGGNIKFTKYPGLDHNIWYKTYNNDQLYEWFLKNKRK